MRFAQTNFRTRFFFERKRPVEVISEELHEHCLTAPGGATYDLKLYNLELAKGFEPPTL